MTSQPTAKLSPTPPISSDCSADATPAKSLPAGTSGKLAAVGAGVGVPLAAAIVVAGTLLLQEKRRSRNLINEKHRLSAEADHYRREVNLQECGPQIRMGAFMRSPRRRNRQSCTQRLQDIDGQISRRFCNNQTRLVIMRSAAYSY